MNRLFLLLFCFISLISSGCKRKPPLAQVGRTNNAQEALKVACSYDIPLMFQAKNISKEEIQNTTVFSYTTPVSWQETQRFYSQEMERLGWKQTSSYEGSFQALGCYEKPHTSTAILITQEGKNTKVVIFMAVRIC